MTNEPIQWRRSTADYQSLTAVEFDTDRDLTDALAVFHEEDDLRGAPFRPVGRQTIFVPDEAVPSLTAHFKARSFRFHTSKVIRRGELSAEQYAAFRREQKLRY